MVAAIGLLLGRLRVGAVSLGIAGVLFAGLAVAHLGAVVQPLVLEFTRDFGLVLFVYAVGIQVGPGFLASFRRNGLPLNLIAAASVLLSSLLAALISRTAHLEVPAAVGMLSGAVTNTPSLGAAQAALRDLPSYTEQTGLLPGLGYAVSYPFGVVGPILAMLLFEPLFRALKGDRVRRHAGEKKVNPPPPPVSTPNADQVLPIAVGLVFGVFVGSIPIPVHGLPAPLRLGLAGGPLIVAIMLGARGRLGPFDWRLRNDTAAFMRDFGVVLFLACVGLISGARFVETLVAGDGVKWMALAAIITFVPLIMVATLARFGVHASFPMTCGLLSGSTTNPAALAFGLAHVKSNEVTLTYATIYPLTMVLRVLATQLFVLLLMR